MSNDVIHFSVSYRTRLSVDRFLHVSLFHHFCPKIDTNAHFDYVISNIERFNKKTINAVRFSIISVPTNFMCLQLKVPLEMCY